MLNNAWAQSCSTAPAKLRIKSEKADADTIEQDALNLEYKSHGAHRTRRLHKLLRTADLVYARCPEGDDNSIVWWTLRRGTALSIKVAAAVSEECTRASSLAKAMYSGDQAVTWHVINAIRRGDRETQLGLRLPVIKTKTHLEMADWRNNLFFDTQDLGILSTENPNESSFHLCPLPMLTHPSGSYFKSDVYSRAVKAAGIEISKLKEMVNLSREVHPPGVVIAHANFIQGSRLKRLALIRLAARSWALSKDWKEPPAGTGLNWPEQPCRGEVWQRGVCLCE